MSVYGVPENFEVFYLATKVLSLLEFCMASIENSHVEDSSFSFRC